MKSKIVFHLIVNLLVYLCYVIYMLSAPCNLPFNCFSMNCFPIYHICKINFKIAQAGIINSLTTPQFLVIGVQVAPGSL